MSGRGGGWSRLERARDRLTKWRAAHGGRGIPLPKELWAEAVEVARIEGVAVTARTLRMDRERLAARLEPADATAPCSAEVSERFVEVDTGRLCAPARTVLRFEGQGGERLEVELGDGTVLDLVGLAKTFWDRRG